MFCQKLGSVFLAHWLASGPDAIDPNLTRPSRFDSGQFCTIWPRPSLEKQNQIRCGKLDLAYMIWPDSDCTMAITGQNQNTSKLDPACLLCLVTIFIHVCVFVCVCVCVSYFVKFSALPFNAEDGALTKFAIIWLYWCFVDIWLESFY